jgi:hypothetical protein
MNLEVIVPQAPLREVHVTEDANKCVANLMSTNVQLKVAGHTKCLAAKVAYVRLLGAVSELVCAEVTQHGEGLLAVTTLVRPLTRVCANVRLQMRNLHESLATCWTLVRALP